MPAPHPILRCSLKERRQQKGLSQEDLAGLVGIRRQAVYDIEAGRYLPNTLVALRLARVLGCAVEELFAEDAPRTTETFRLIGGPAASAERLALARVRGELVGAPLRGTEALSFGLRPTDGLLRPDAKGVEVLLPSAELEKAVLVLGCDPALDLLREHAARLAPAIRVHPVFASSGQALRTLAEGAAHIAGTHFHNAGGDEANVQAVRALFPEAACAVIAFASQEEGLMIASGNSLGIRGVEDLSRPDVRLVNRENGAALRKLLDGLLARRGIPAASITGYRNEARSHSEGAFRVACGAADAALGLRVVAQAFGLDFLPLASTRCDLVIPEDLHSHPGVAVILDLLQSARLRRELEALPGYDASSTGRIIR